MAILCWPPDRRDWDRHIRGIGSRASRDAALRIHCGERLQAGSSCARPAQGESIMRVGIASDHGGFALKEQIADLLRGRSEEVVDFGALHPSPGDDSPIT